MNDEKMLKRLTTACPFCGESDARPIEYMRGSPAVAVVCAMCGAQGPWSAEKAEAVRLWKQRAPSQPQAQPAPTEDAAAPDSLMPFTVVYKVEYQDCVEHVMATTPVDAVAAAKRTIRDALAPEDRAFYDPDNDGDWTEYDFVAVFAGHLQVL